MPSETQEAAVRNYLQALQDPESLRDENAIDHLQKRLDDTEDPLERVKLRAELERAQQVDPRAYEDGFVTHAKQWAREHGVSATSFRAEGVSHDVLARAGLARARPRRLASASNRPRRVSRDEVRNAMRQHKSFTMPQVQLETGASRETVRAVLKELLDAGEVHHAGTDDSHTTRGRAASLYQRT